MTLTARDVHAHLQHVGTWVNWDATCDGFKYGNPDSEVGAIAVSWQSSQAALQEAHDLGCNLFVTHEPTFYSHMDDNQAMHQTVPAQQKMAFLKETGMTVYRCHDVWDVFPRIGVVDAWGEYLELGDVVASCKYYAVHEIPSTTAWELANRIAQRVAPLGEQSVRFVGTKWQMVRRLAVGTGAITNVRRMVELGADVLLTTDDGITLWRDGAWIADLGLPMIMVNHTTSEIPGLRNLAKYLGEQFPDVPVHFVGATCGYEICATQRYRDVGIRMRCNDLSVLPDAVVPDGYSLKPMEADQAWAYVEVMNRSNYAGDADEAWFESAFSRDPEYDPAHLQLIWKGDVPVAAAGAWHCEIDGDKWGMIHWVGVLDSERGNGLGKAVTLAALRRIRERGFSRAMLITGNWRLAAVAAYLRLGFEPWPDKTGTQEVWDAVLRDLDAWRQWGAPRSPA